jgi:DNA-binding MurR/RpiR family transcriptional regulator
MTAAKLGETLGISESTVVRFASGIGYSGYPEFQKALEDCVKGKLSNIQRIDAKYGRSSQSEILTSVLSADIEKLQDIVRIFKREQNVMIAGDTRELACFNLFQLDLACQGISALFKNINDISGSFAGYLRNEKCALCLISVYKGWYTEEIRTLANQAKQYHHPVILFTQDEAVASDDMDLVFTYGIPGSINDGYYSLHYLADMMSAMLYLEE